MSRFPTRAIAFLLIPLLAACGGMGAKRSPRDAMLYEYVSAIRWSDFDRAVGFIEPEALEADPLGSIELERYKQFQVTGYDVRTSSEPAEGEYEQVVEIRMVNRHTQAEKMLVDRQRWRWDEEDKRWWLVSGLPDLDDLRSE
jgi:hypothetical protein